MTQSYIFIAILGLNALPIVSAQSDKSITIHQEIEFNATPQQLYDALLDSKQFSEFSGRAAEINREVGGAFSLFKGHIIGRNVELVPNERIVQAWRVVTWPEGVYSIVRFELKPQGSGTHLVFDQSVFRKAYTTILLRDGKRTIGRCSRNISTSDWRDSGIVTNEQIRSRVIARLNSWARLCMRSAWRVVSYLEPSLEPA